MFVHEVVLVPGWQLRQPLLGFNAFVAITDPPMKHPLWHEPMLQTWPLPQEVPSVLFVHDEVAVAGWQPWQLVLGFDALAAYTMPPMKQPS